MLNEQALRYSRISMDPSTHSWYENYGTNKLTVDGFQAESGIEAPVIGNGWIPEIEDNATFDYNPNNGLDHKLIEAITNVLATRSPEEVMETPSLRLLTVSVVPPLMRV